MKIFLDTADVEAIRRAYATGLEQFAEAWRKVKK